jgi:WD40 repeat protein
MASRRPRGETFVGTPIPAGLVMDLELSSDGNVLAWGIALGGLYAWHDPIGAQPDKRVMDHEAPAQNVALSPDGELLAAAVASDARMWDTGSGEPVAEDAMASFSRVTAVSDVAFTPDGKSLVVAGDDGVRIWPTPVATAPS